MKSLSIVGAILREPWRALSRSRSDRAEGPTSEAYPRTARRSLRSTRGSVALPRSAGNPVAPAPSPRVPIDKPVRHHGTVHVIQSRCKECEFCVTFCPEEVLEISDRYTSRGYRPAQVKKGKEDDCIACRFCEDVCPEYAIYIVETTP